jgi:hypothetical protein
VDAEGFAASTAGPPGLLALDEAAQPLGFDAPEILDHAHAVLRAITLVEVVEPLARKARALAAEISVLSASLRAILDSARHDSHRFAVIVAPATRAFIPAS